MLQKKKLISAAAILVNLALLRIGYSDNVLNAANITGDTRKTMYAESVLIPAVLYILIFFILRFIYPIGKDKIDEMREMKNRLN